LNYLKILIQVVSFPDERTGPYCAPSILITFINMVLFKQNTAPAQCDPYMFAGQVRDSIVTQWK